MKPLWGLVIVFACAAHAEGIVHAEIAGRASVVDGDTIEIQGERIRLDGIDAFETRQLCERDGQPWRCGQQGALALSDFLGQRTVRCRETGLDRYRRTLARCAVAGADIGAWVVEQGWALAYRRYSLDYVPQEEAARDRKAGAWSGTFEAPWDWRHRER